MITEYRMQSGEREILIRVKRSSRRTMSLEIKQTGEVLARIPMELPDGELKAFIRGHQDWIIEKLAISRQKSRDRGTTEAAPVKELKKGELEDIKAKIAGRVLYYGNLMGVTWGRITIRNQKTRWGSCSSKGNLNFNYQLYYLDDRLLDYVVVHELAHRRHMNHSREFWQEVERYCPDYRECRRHLKEIRLV